MEASIYSNHPLEMIASSSHFAFRVQNRLLTYTFATLRYFLICHVFITYCYTVRSTAGISMSPTLNAIGDWVLISRRYRRGRNIDVGDVVTFHHPVKLGEGGIKRVVAMPGDIVLRDTPGNGDGLLLKVRSKAYEITDTSNIPNLS